MNSPLQSRLDRRRATLIQRVDRILEQQATGEGSTTRLELELVADEMAHITDLYRTMLLMCIHERLFS